MNWQKKTKQQNRNIPCFVNKNETYHFGAPWRSSTSNQFHSLRVLEPDGDFSEKRCFSSLPRGRWTTTQQSPQHARHDLKAPPQSRIFQNHLNHSGIHQQVLNLHHPGVSRRTNRGRVETCVWAQGCSVCQSCHKRAIKREGDKATEEETALATESTDASVTAWTPSSLKSVAFSTHDAYSSL